MIRGLRLLNFKNFADARLPLGPFTVIVGTNASGKSNIRDAFRFLHGIGRGYTLAETIGGRYGAGGQQEWASLRGAASEIVRFGQPGFGFEVELEINKRRAWYKIEVVSSEKSRGGFEVKREELHIGGTVVYTSHPGGNDPVERQDDEAHLLLRMEKTGTQKKYGERVAVRPDQPALTQIEEFKRVARPHKDNARDVLQVFGAIRFLDLVPDQMRKPAFPGQNVLGDSGENLPTVLQEIWGVMPLTYHDHDVESAGQASATDEDEDNAACDEFRNKHAAMAAIPVSPAMIAEGLGELIMHQPGWNGEEIVVRIYRAMRHEHDKEMRAT